MNEMKNHKSNPVNGTNHALHLYAPNVNKYPIQAQFLSIAKDEKTVYITNDSKQALKEFEGLDAITVVQPENLDKLKAIKSRLRIVVDGGSIDTNPLSFEGQLASKLGGNYSIMCTYPIGKADSNTVKQLVANHDNLILTTEDKIILSSNKFDKLGLSEETLEKFVKNYLETVILALILKQPMCGTDIIKTIHKEFNVLLSPAAIYPLLDKLMKGGLLNCKYGIKKKVYEVAEKQKVKITVDEHLQANQLLFQHLKHGGENG